MTLIEETMEELDCDRSTAIRLMVRRIGAQLKEGSIEVLGTETTENNEIEIPPWAKKIVFK